MTLLSRLAQAKGPDRELDALVGAHFGYDGWTPEKWAKAKADLSLSRDACPTGCPEYTASFDAVLRELPEGWFWRVGHSTLYGGWAHLNRKHPNHCDVGDEYSANAETPAIALLIVILRARGIE